MPRESCISAAGICWGKPIPEGKGQHYTERPLLAAWEVKSPLTGAKLLLCVSKDTELLRRRDLLRLQVKQRALRMDDIKCNGPLMENHLIGTEWFLSCGANPSSWSECGTLLPQGMTGFGSSLQHFGVLQ